MTKRPRRCQVCACVLPIVACLALLPLTGHGAGAETKKILGIFYRGCEETCEGFQERLAESGLDVEFVVRDVAQDKSQFPSVVEEARATKADLVLTWGTSVTLGIVGKLSDAGDVRFLNDIPVVFTVVADPFGSGVAESFDGSGRANVTGTFNRVPEPVNVQIIRQYDPGFKKLGLLYNANEANSVLKLKELSELAPTLGVELVAFELPTDGKSPPEAGAIAEGLAKLKEAGVKWMYLGSSSFLRANAKVLGAAAADAGIGLVTPYEDMVVQGNALLSVAARYHDVGRLAADQALKILKDGATPGDLPIVAMTDFAYVINMDVAKELDRYPPFAFLQVAETVGGE
jgi:putative ABC transport system substrate-binding protein